MKSNGEIEVGDFLWWKHQGILEPNQKDLCMVLEKHIIDSRVILNVWDIMDCCIYTSIYESNLEYLCS